MTWKFDNYAQSLISDRWHRQTQFVSRKEGGRGVASIENCVDASIQQLEDCIEKSEERLIITANCSSGNINSAGTTTKSRKLKWEENHQYGFVNWQTIDIAHEKTKTWLQKENLRRETESLLIAAQNNVTKTNYIKRETDNTWRNGKSTRRKRDETDCK